MLSLKDKKETTQSAVNSYDSSYDTTQRSTPVEYQFSPQWLQQGMNWPPKPHEKK